MLDVFDPPVIGRCQLHKIRNVQIISRRSCATVAAADAAGLSRRLRAGRRGRTEALAAELDRTHPGAAASLREGMAETLTVLRLGVPPTLARTLRSTNAIESMISICRDHASNVKRWRDGQMALRWCAAGMIEAEQAVPPGQRPPAPAIATRPRSNGMSPPKPSATTAMMTT